MQALKGTYVPSTPLPGFAPQFDKAIAATVKEQLGDKALADFLMPYFHSEQQSMGSTDVGDVSYQTPTAQINTVTYPVCAPGHSWQNVAAGKNGVAHKGELLAARVLAGAAIDLFEKPEVLAAAREEWKLAAPEGYICPIEPDAVPTVVGGKM